MSGNVIDQQIILLSLVFKEVKNLEIFSVLTLYHSTFIWYGIWHINRLRTRVRFFMAWSYCNFCFVLFIQGFSIDWCKQPDCGLPRPDLVLYLNLRPDAAAKRGNFGNERYEQTDFQAKVMKNFHLLKESYWKVVFLILLFAWVFEMAPDNKIS